MAEQYEQYFSLQSSIKDELLAQQKEGFLCDVKIKMGKDEAWAHRCVLAAASSHVRTLLMKDPLLTEVNVPMGNCKVGEGTLLCFVEYLYGKEIKVTQDDVESIIHLAKIFVSDELLDGCLKLLLKNINVDNCIRMWNLFEENNLDEASIYCKDFIFTYFHNHYISSKEILTVHPSRMIQLLTDGLGRHCEEENMKRFLAKYKKTRLISYSIPVDAFPRRSDGGTLSVAGPLECVVIKLHDRSVLYLIEQRCFLNLKCFVDYCSFKFLAIGLGLKKKFAFIESDSYSYYNYSKPKTKLINIFTGETRDIHEMPKKKIESSALKVKRGKCYYFSYIGNIYCIYGSKVELDRNIELIQSECEALDEEKVKSSILFRQPGHRPHRKTSLIYIMKYNFEIEKWTLVCSVAERDSEYLKVYVEQKNYKEIYIYGLMGNTMMSYVFDFERHELLTLHTSHVLAIPNAYSDYPGDENKCTITRTSDKLVIKHANCQQCIVYSISENIWRVQDTEEVQLHTDGLSNTDYSYERGLAYGFEYKDDQKTVKFHSCDINTGMRTELCPPPFLTSDEMSDCRILYVPGEVVSRLEPAALQCNTNLMDRWQAENLVSRWRKNRLQSQQENN